MRVFTYFQKNKIIQHFTSFAPPYFGWMLQAPPINFWSQFLIKNVFLKFLFLNLFTNVSYLLLKEVLYNQLLLKCPQNFQSFVFYIYVFLGWFIAFVFEVFFNNYAFLRLHFSPLTHDLFIEAKYCLCWPVQEFHFRITSFQD